MVVGDANINNIMGGMENAIIVKQHSHKKKLRQRFDIIKKLGQGTFGKVQLGINKETGQEVAIKTIKKSKIESEADLVRIRREIQIMSSVQHPNIIHIYEVFENREKMVLVMEYAAGGELYDYLSERKVLNEDEARRIFRQIATACYYCHKHKICHRDLKLENILLDENNNAKIADFGLSNVFDDQRLLNTFCGSPLYASPEIVKGTPYHGPEVDCWSLGVLLYTLVYGAMPFDGSNFKRLVKQISQGDYFEPTKPSPASPLIRDMLTCNPKSRADIEKICTHWWVNETYDDNCLEISEELANQTPVRLDLLLSLAPPAPQLESDKLMVTGGDAGDEEINNKTDDINAAPVRSQSVGSLMDFTHPAERRIKDLIKENEEEQKKKKQLLLIGTPKRKLENTVSTDRMNLKQRKDKIIKENTIADITLHGTIKEDELLIPLDKSLTQTLSSSKEMDVEEQEEEKESPVIEGAACAEILQEEEAAKKKSSSSSSNQIINESQILEGINEIPSQESITTNNSSKNDKQIKDDKENVEKKIEPKKKLEDESSKIASPTKKKIVVVKKKVLTDKNENVNAKATDKTPVATAAAAAIENEEVVKKEANQKEKVVDSEEVKPIERRRSRIFEAAEKFQNMITPPKTEQQGTKPTSKTTPHNNNNNNSNKSIEKPKKIVIPGVSVDGFKKEFERKASLTSTSPPKLKAIPPPKKTTIESKDNIQSAEPTNMDRVKNAVSIISSAIQDKEGGNTRKSKSRPCCIRKPPVPFGISGRSASGNIGLIASPLSPPPVTTVGPKPFIKSPQITDAKVKRVVEDDEPPQSLDENKISSAEITLKSATLPRRKTTKAQIQLNFPQSTTKSMGFKTEMAHPVEAAPQQRSEVVVPVGAAAQFRAGSLEPDKSSPKERIIPISFERSGNNNNNNNNKENNNVQSPPPTKPPVAKVFQTQKSNQSQKGSESLSRQSTQESDSETVSSGEPIRKSPREYIIPIAVEGGGYVTPRAGSLEPSETASTVTSGTNKSRTKFGRARRMSSLLSDRDSEDESSPFSTLHRSFGGGKDGASDTEDTRRNTDFPMHRLRSTRPKKSTLDHADSVSSGEEDDDDGFEILTAENLFSTLLSRVRDLTQRLNVEDGGRPGFPKSRLLSHFDHGTNFWNLHNRMDHPLSRHSSLSRGFSRDRSNTGNNSPTATTPGGGTSTTSNLHAPWRRSVSRDLASDIESVFNDTNRQTLPRPRGDRKSTNNNNNNDDGENLNLADLDLKKIKLSDEDALALSYLTPGLSKRIQKQLFSQLPPSEVKKLHRTLSTRCHPSNNYCDDDDNNLSQKFRRRSVDRLADRTNKNNSDFNLNEPTITSVLPRNYHYVRSNLPSATIPTKSSDYEIINTSATRPITTTVRSLSLREPKKYATTLLRRSPDSSLSESSSLSTPHQQQQRQQQNYIKYSSPDSSTTTTTTTTSLNKYSITPTTVNNNKTDSLSSLKKPRRISRFLRPDFFDSPPSPAKDENVFVKEKKEREMETQKVLKEIRDKRKGKFRRDRSKNDDPNTTSGIVIKDCNDLLNNVSNNIRNLESHVANSNNINNNSNTLLHDYVNVLSSSSSPGGKNHVIIPDYVNVQNKNRTDDDTNNKSTAVSEMLGVPASTSPPPPPSNIVLIKKERVSKIARPKSYPSETTTTIVKNNNNNKAMEKESKISRLKRGCFSRQSPTKSNKTDKDDKNESNEDAKTSLVAAAGPQPKNKLLQSIEKKLEKFRSTPKDEIKRNSGVEQAIKRLREQSLPRNIDNHYCTESGLIKRAVSVEDIMSNQPLQASRKSVTKILGLFKKYEKKGGQEGEKNKTKTKDDDDNTMKDKKSERPRSIVVDLNNDDDDDNNNNGVVTEKLMKSSKLPLVNRRSLNLDLLDNNNSNNNNNNNNRRMDRSNLKLDLLSPTSPISGDDNSSNTAFLSPGDDNLSDSWSVCSTDLNANSSSSSHHLPQMLNGHSGNNIVCSGDENESVSDRIRRKSFYTRFNEKKKKPSSGSSTRTSYKDLDLYKDFTLQNKLLPTAAGGSSSSSMDYGSLDRRSYKNHHRPVISATNKTGATLMNKNHYVAGDLTTPTMMKKRLINDYVNVPTNRYQIYNNNSSKIIGIGSNSSRPTSSIYSEDSEDNNNPLDDLLSKTTAAKSRKYSSHLQPSSRLNRTSVSPVCEQFVRPASSVMLNNNNSSNNNNSPTSSEPI